MGDEVQQCVRDIVDALRVLYGTIGFHTDVIKPLFVGESTSGCVCLITPCSVAKSPEFALECMLHLPEGRDTPWVLLQDL